MSDSDRPEKPAWPSVELRQATRRGARARRLTAADPPADERRIGERRSEGERRDDEAWDVIPLDSTLPTILAPVETLIAAAITSRRFAQARYSTFQVGAALETGDGVLVTGCNIENATYGLTLCAERVALVKALSEGHSEFRRIAVVADTDRLTPPCGPCRQLLWEYCGDLEILLANLKGATASYRLSALLPLPFDARLLDPGQ